MRRNRNQERKANDWIQTGEKRREIRRMFQLVVTIIKKEERCFDIAMGGNLVSCKLSGQICIELKGGTRLIVKSSSGCVGSHAIAILNVEIETLVKLSWLALTKE